MRQNLVNMSPVSLWKNHRNSLRGAGPRGRTSKEPTRKKLHRYVEKVRKKYVIMVVLLRMAAHCLALVLTSSQGLTVTHDPKRVTKKLTKSTPRRSPWPLGTLSGTTWNTRCILRPSWDSFFTVLASLNDTLGNLWGALFETFLLLGGPRTVKSLHF